MEPQSILLLDDEHDIVFTFKRSLELDGFSVFGFTDPILALEHFRNNVKRYALILTDVRMPNMDGLEFASKARELGGDVKILLMSAFDMKDLAIEPSLAIAGLLQKPISPMDLRNKIHEYMLAPDPT